MMEAALGSFLRSLVPGQKLPVLRPLSSDSDRSG